MNVAPSIGPLDRAVGSRPAATCRRRFVVNGRFYAQRTTGVQRYGREIIRALDEQLADGSGSGGGEVVVPGRASDMPAFKTLALTRTGFLSGPAWEQAVLPFHASECLLNLCNTGPLLARQQIVCMHDANIFNEPQSYSRAFQLYYRILLPLLGNGRARLTTVSDASRRDLARHLSVSAASIDIVPNGHEHVFGWDPSKSRLAPGLREGRPFVLLLGSRAPHKNAALVLNQAERLDELGLDLAVAGGGASIFAQTTSVERPNIRWLGVVSDDDLACLYAHALCLAFPSRFEGFGLPIVEAMALGCPVVSSNAASMPEVCGAAALLAEPDDPAAWLRHFAALAASASLRSDLRDKGREQVRRFSWRNSAAQYLDLVERAA